MHLGLGTAAIGRPHYINIKHDLAKQEMDLEMFKIQGLQVLDQAYNSGIRYFDTAPGYGFAEELLIEWIDKIRDPEIEIATKWGYTYTADFDPNAKQHEVKEHSIDKLNQQWAHSKKIIPYLSTYQVHSATFESGVLSNQPVLRRLSELKEHHNLRVGITTSGPNQLEVLKRALEIEVEGSRLFEVFQVTYNLLDQRIEEIFDDSIVLGQRFVIKEALANGRLFPNKQYRHYQPLYRYLRILAEKYSVGLDAVALRFCLDSVKPFMVLSGASQPQHLLYNLMMNQFELTEQEIQRLKNFKVSTDFYWKERSALVWN